MFRRFLVLAALSLLVACGTASSPTPLRNQTTWQADVAWVEPVGTKMLLASFVFHEDRTVILLPQTSFAGGVKSSSELVSAYKQGYRISVRVDAIPVDENSQGNHSTWTALAVTATPAVTFIEHVGPSTVSTLNREPSSAGFIPRWVLFVMPWTTFDQTGDIKSYEEFQAAAASSNWTGTAEGEGWHVTDVATHARHVKFIRSSK